MKSIGVFDSGVGGLTVVKELIRQLPNENIVYFGDTARVPYGIKSRETVIRFSIENILFLLQQDVKLICVACNTASSFALPVIKNYFRAPIIGVISPGVREAVYASKNKRIGVIGTKGTIKSRTYETEIKQLAPEAKVFTASCPLFVPFVEEGCFSGETVLNVAKGYLNPLKDAHVDTVILGCTHYPLLKPLIQQVLGKGVVLIDSAEQVACEVKKILVNEDMLNRGKGGRHSFYVSDNPEWFTSLAQSFLGSKLKNVKKMGSV
ncbi:MAG: glutamate racemase [Candidatus Omnitrophica bacterium]|nr:glutamate racemase [Candidatus Omnitrophota bacterium]MDD5042477.1 glutamate racemase [Candidatus Omnitrophota bacterium]MDD5501122.1 glutamate racemase [Candidatus Omnitrophota bacterium]